MSLSTSILFLNLVLFSIPIQGNFTEIFIFDASSVGYLWFVKYLIYFHFISYIILGKNKKNKSLILVVLSLNIVLILTNQIDILDDRNYNLNIVAYTCGLIYARYEYLLQANFLHKKKYLLLLVFLPFAIGIEYVHAKPSLYIFGFLTFLMFKNVNFKNNYISYLSKNTIYILAFHRIMIYFVSVYALIEKGYSFVLIYIFVLFGTIILLELFKLVEKTLISKLYVQSEKQLSSIIN